MRRYDSVPMIVMMVAAACGSPPTAPVAPAAPPAIAAAPPAIAVAPPPAPAPKLDGAWYGTLDAGSMKIRLVVHLEHGADGAWHATLDSPDQGARGIPVSSATFEAGALHLAFDAFHAAYVATLDSDHLTGTWTQGGAALPFTMSRDAGDKPRRPQQPQPPFPYRERDASVEVLTDPFEPPGLHARIPHITLAGTLTLPPGDGPFPAVLMITGSGPQDRDETIADHKPFLLLADAFARRGIASLRFDDRGVGKSGGEPVGPTTLGLAEDALAELDWLEKQPEIDHRAIGVLGHSEGGTIGPIVATRDPNVHFVIMLAGIGLPGDRALLAQIDAIARASGKPAAAIAREHADQQALYARIKRAKDDDDVDAALRRFVDADPTARAGREASLDKIRARWQWFQSLLAIDPTSYLTRLHVPVLAISGDHDLQVVPDNLPAIDAALHRGHNRDATVKLLPGLNHLFQHTTTGLPTEYGQLEETFAPEALQLVTDWLVERTARLRR